VAGCSRAAFAVRRRGTVLLTWLAAIVVLIGLAIPFATEVRITLAVVGGLIFLIGVVGWVLVEDVQMYPAESADGGEVHH